MCACHPGTSTDAPNDSDVPDDTDLLRETDTTPPTSDDSDSPVESDLPVVPCVRPLGVFDLGLLHRGIVDLPPTSTLVQVVSDYDGDGARELWMSTHDPRTDGSTFWIARWSDLMLNPDPQAAIASLPDLDGRIVSVPADFDGDGSFDFPLPLTCGTACDPTLSSALVDVYLGADLRRWDTSGAGMVLELGPSLEGYGRPAIGELDGSGGADLILGQAGWSNTPELFTSDGRVVVLSGPLQSGVQHYATAAAIIVSDQMDAQLGDDVFVTDLDQDGQDDLLISSRRWDQKGAVVMFRGPITGEHAVGEADNLLVLSDPDVRSDTLDLLDVQDMDGDGYPDLLATVAKGRGTPPRLGVLMVPGPLLQATSAEDAQWRVDSQQLNDITSAAVAGDLDRDGLQDVVLFGGAWPPPDCPPTDTGGDSDCPDPAPGRGMVWVIWGDTHGDFVPYNLPFGFYQHDVDMYPSFASGAGDLDGDGWDDLIVYNNDVNQHTVHMVSPCAP